MRPQSPAMGFLIGSWRGLNSQRRRTNGSPCMQSLKRRSVAKGRRPPVPRPRSRRARPTLMKLRPRRGPTQPRGF
eukprot:11207226-Lingulodinium_polyedra.AAC.1